MDQVTLPRATVQQVLEALEQLVIGTEYEEAVATEKTITALKAALEQPRQFTFAPKPPSPPPASQGYDGTEAGLNSFSWRGNE